MRRSLPLWPPMTGTGLCQRSWKWGLGPTPSANASMARIPEQQRGAPSPTGRFPKTVSGFMGSPRGGQEVSFTTYRSVAGATRAEKSCLRRNLPTSYPQEPVLRIQSHRGSPCMSFLTNLPFQNLPAGRKMIRFRSRTKFPAQDPIFRPGFPEWRPELDRRERDWQRRHNFP